MKSITKYSLLLILIVSGSASLFGMDNTLFKLDKATLQHQFSESIAQAANSNFNFFDLQNIRNLLYAGAKKNIPFNELGGKTYNALDGKTATEYLKPLLEGTEKGPYKNYLSQALGLLRTYSNLRKK